MIRVRVVYKAVLKEVVIVTAEGKPIVISPPSPVEGVVISISLVVPENLAVVVLPPPEPTRDNVLSFDDTAPTLNA